MPPLSPITEKVWDVIGERNPTTVGHESGVDTSLSDEELQDGNS